MSHEWRDSAITEARSVKKLWAIRYEWDPIVIENDDWIDLFIQFRIKGNPERIHILRLRYEMDFETAGRREAFVNPENHEEAHLQYWPTGVGVIKNTHNPPAICLWGTWGFHSVLHKDEDGRKANLNILLIEIQQCLNP